MKKNNTTEKEKKYIKMCYKIVREEVEAKRQNRGYILITYTETNIGICCCLNV